MIQSILNINQSLLKKRKELNGKEIDEKVTKIQYKSSF
jgi:hypothetical protein